MTSKMTLRDSFLKDGATPHMVDTYDKITDKISSFDDWDDYIHFISPPENQTFERGFEVGFYKCGYECCIEILIHPYKGDMRITKKYGTGKIQWVKYTTDVNKVVQFLKYQMS